MNVARARVLRVNAFHKLFFDVSFGGNDDVIYPPLLGGRAVTIAVEPKVRAAGTKWSLSALLISCAGIQLLHNSRARVCHSVRVLIIYDHCWWPKTSSYGAPKSRRLCS